MATPNEKLSESLAVLKSLQETGRRVYKSKELTRIHRERLLRNGFIQEVMKGWLISSRPAETQGESTPWYASFWEFCARYCDERFGHQWYLSPEQSLLLHAENNVIPAQVIVFARKGTNNTVKLLFETSLYDLKQQRMPPGSDVTIRDGLRIISPASAIIKVPESFFNRYPVETQIALATIKDPSDVLGRLLEGGHSVVAGRLAGAFRRIARPEVADQIVATMKGAGYQIRETDPFKPQQTLGKLRPTTAPIVARVQTLWASMRGAVLAGFPDAPGLPKNRGEYLRNVDELYNSDAYNSLSIEGYRVTPELIERVRSGGWDPERDHNDRQNQDALAARGYWQAFQLVKATVTDVIAGANPGTLVRTAHRDWYRELFQPCVTAGLLKAQALAGYRNDAVYLRTSRYVPPRWEAVRDAMPALVDLLEKETEAAVRAVLGHWLFGYIHPYPDGNGRMARFLMNAMLASGGYPWTVIRVEERAEYLKALNSASIDAEIGPFTQLLGECVRRSMTHAPRPSTKRPA